MPPHGLPPPRAGHRPHRPQPDCGCSLVHSPSQPAAAKQLSPDTKPYGVSLASTRLQNAFSRPRPTPPSRCAHARPFRPPIGAAGPAPARRLVVWAAGVILRVTGSGPVRAGWRYFFCLPSRGRHSVMPPEPPESPQVARQPRKPPGT